MTASEAYKYISTKFKHLDVYSCVEYSSRFVFNMIGKDIKKTVDAGRVIASSFSVDKKTNNVTYFSPSDISFDEYVNGKLIESWDEKSAGENYIKHSADMMNGVFVGRKK